MNSFTRLLRQMEERNVRKTLAFYISIALTTIGIIKLFIEVYDLPAMVFSVAVTVLTIGTANAFLYAWQKGARNSQPSRTVGNVLHVVFFALAAVISYRTASSNAATTQPDPSSSVVAVLPFANMNGNPGDEFFSDGITEDILTHLSKIADLRVISRTSVMQYKSTTKSIREIGQELGAGSILEGSVRWSGSRIRIVGQLIDARTDGHLWSETYDREITDVFAIQSDVAQQIARALKTALSPAESTLIGHQSTANLDAYTYYLRGRDLYYRFTRDDNEAAIGMFRQAIAADSEYAIAYAGLADAFAQRVQRFGFDAAWADSAIETSLKAIRLDARIAEPYKSLGLAYAQREWYHKAMDQFSMALRINPNFSAAVSNLGLIHLWIGDPVNALPLIKKASILSPEQTIHNFHLASLYDALGIDPLAERYYRKTIALDETSSYAYRALAQLLIVTGRTSEARGMLEAALRRQEDDPYLLLGAGEVELFDGKPEKAEGYYRRAADVLGGNFIPTTQLGFILLQTGRETEGRNLLRESLAITEEALAGGSENYDHSLDRARVFAIQQDTTEALHWLGKAIDAGWMLERILAMDPQLQSLKGNRMFAEQLAQLRARNSEARRRLTENGMLN